jgi:hypothetical protein
VVKSLRVTVPSPVKAYESNKELEVSGLTGGKIVTKLEQRT